MGAQLPLSDAFLDAVSSCLALGPSFHANILVKDTLAVPGVFLSQILLRMAVQAGHKVLLVPVAQSVDKYKFVLKKMGVNLQQALDEGQVVVVQPSSVLTGQQHQQGGPQGHAASKGRSPLRELHAQMVQAASSLAASAVDSQGAHAGGPDNAQQSGQSSDQGSQMHGAEASISRGSLTVIMDGLTELSLLAASKKEWLSFLHYSMHLGAQHQEIMAINRVLLCHVDDELLAEDVSWLTLLEHGSRLTLYVEPMEGHIADLDGRVTFSYRQPPVSAAARHAAAGGGGSLAAAVALVPEQAFVPVSSMYFRGGETGVRWISELTSKDLLWQ